MICRFIPLALLAAACLPHTAEAHYWPFYVSNQSSTTYCIEVFGPSQRSSGTQNVDPGQSDYEFYQTWDWITSSSGQWRAQLYAYKSQRGGCDDRLAGVGSPLYFCFNPYPQGVHITIRQGPGLSLDRSAGSCDSSTASAVLGDSRRDNWTATISASRAQSASA